MSTAYLNMISFLYKIYEREWLILQKKSFFPWGTTINSYLHQIHADYSFAATLVGGLAFFACEIRVEGWRMGISTMEGHVWDVL